MGDIATRAMIVSLKASNKTTIEVMALTGVGKSTINSIFARAVARGFDPAVRPIVLTDALLADNPRSGRPSKQSAATEERKAALILLAILVTSASRFRLRRSGEYSAGLASRRPSLRGSLV